MVDTLGLLLEVIVTEANGSEGINGLALVVERTFAWLMQKGRLVVDYEKLTETSESLIYIAMVHLMSKRLSQNQRQIA